MNKTQLTHSQERDVGVALRILCKLGHLQAAKALASMPDEVLADLVDSDRLAATVVTLVEEHERK